MYNYSLDQTVNVNILFKAIVTRMNNVIKYLALCFCVVVLFSCEYYIIINHLL